MGPRSARPGSVITTCIPRKNWENGCPGRWSWRGRTTDTYLIFNNHYRGQAVRNARMMAQLLPPELVVPLAPEETGPALF